MKRVIAFIKKSAAKTKDKVSEHRLNTIKNIEPLVNSAREHSMGRKIGKIWAIIMELVKQLYNFSPQIYSPNVTFARLQFKERPKLYAATMSTFSFFASYFRQSKIQQIQEKNIENINYRSSQRWNHLRYYFTQKKQDKPNQENNKLAKDSSFVRFKAYLKSNQKKQSNQNKEKQPKLMVKIGELFGFKEEEVNKINKKFNQTVQPFNLHILSKQEPKHNSYFEKLKWKIRDSTIGKIQRVIWGVIWKVALVIGFIGFLFNLGRTIPQQLQIYYTLKRQQESKKKQQQMKQGQNKIGN